MKTNVNSAPSFDEINQLLAKYNCFYSPSEVHGIAVGLLCVNVRATNEDWLAHIYAESEIPIGDKESDRFFESIREELMEAHSFSFKLLLPDDEDAIADRVEAMQEWTQGFLLGVAMGGLQDFKGLPEDSRELLKDFNDISGSTDLEFAEDDESEEAYLQIVEYLRVGSLLISDELRSIQPDETIH